MILKPSWFGPINHVLYTAYGDSTHPREPHTVCPRLCAGWVSPDGCCLKLSCLSIDLTSRYGPSHRGYIQYMPAWSCSSWAEHGASPLPQSCTSALCCMLCYSDGGPGRSNHSPAFDECANGAPWTAWRGEQVCACKIKVCQWSTLSKLQGRLSHLSMLCLLCKRGVLLCGHLFFPVRLR